MMTLTELLGPHDCHDPQTGMSMQELYELLRRVPRRVRESNYMMVSHPDGSRDDVRGLHFAQSDQAEKHEFKVYVSTTGSRE